MLVYYILFVSMSIGKKRMVYAASFVSHWWLHFMRFDLLLKSQSLAIYWACLQNTSKKLMFCYSKESFKWATACSHKGSPYNWFCTMSTNLWPNSIFTYENDSLERLPDNQDLRSVNDSDRVMYGTQFNSTYFVDREPDVDYRPTTESTIPLGKVCRLDKLHVGLCYISLARHV